MKSLKKMADLADRFEWKLKYGQSIVGEDPKSVTTDAFFGPQGEQTFQKAIIAPGSKFLAALPNGINCDIGATVDTSAGIADFLITLKPPSKDPNVLTNVKNALLADYIATFKASPTSRMAARIKDPDDKLKPGLKTSHPAIITIT